MAVLAKVSKMPEHDGAMGKRLHAMIKARDSPLAETLDGMPDHHGTGLVHQRQMRVAKPL